jgi:hypothetical protein
MVYSQGKTDAPLLGRRRGRTPTVDLLASSSSTEDSEAVLLSPGTPPSAPAIQPRDETQTSMAEAATHILRETMCQLHSHQGKTDD